MKVSIITPVFNGRFLLPEAVASVQTQTCNDWEWIIVNDGSTDGTAAYLDTLTDPRIHVVHQSNAGVSSARNVGLSLARGDFITFLDADDALPERSLEVRLAFFDQYPSASVVDGHVLIKDATLNATLRERVGGPLGPYFPRLIRLDSAVFFNVAVMVRREAIGSTRFQTGLSHCEDLLFFLEASNRNAWIYGAVDELVYCYRTGIASAMSNMDGLQRGYLFLYERCQKLEDATTADLDYLYHRIRRILVRSWLRQGRPVRALKAWCSLRALRAGLVKREPVVLT